MPRILGLSQSKICLNHNIGIIEFVKGLLLSHPVGSVLCSPEFLTPARQDAPGRCQYEIEEGFGCTLFLLAP